jgi:hypothetical protein
MKKEKGDAAFGSVDEVLTDRIIDTSEKHGKDEGTPDPDSTSNYTYDAECGETGKHGNHTGKAIIIAACAGLVLLVIGIVLFRCRKCTCGK